MADNWHDMTALQLGARIEAGGIDPADLAEHFLARIAEGDQDQKARHQTAEKIQMTRGLFGGVSYAKLASLASQDYTIKTTQLSDEFSYEDFLAKSQRRARVLFVFDSKGHVLPVMDMESLKPEKDWMLISLVPPQARKERKEREDKEGSEQPAETELPTNQTDTP